jgi:SAM-dependent methyltransferase
MDSDGEINFNQEAEWVPAPQIDDLGIQTLTQQQNEIFQKIKNDDEITQNELSIIYNFIPQNMIYDVFNYMSKHKLYIENPSIYISVVINLFHSLDNKKDMYLHLTRTVKFVNNYYLTKKVFALNIVKLYTCVFGAHKLLKKINTEIIQKYINYIFIKKFIPLTHYKHLTYPSFLYFEKYMSNIDYKNIFKKLCITNDERLFKYIINKLDFGNYSVNDIEDIINNLRVKKSKFVLKRLKYINNYYDLSKDIPILFSFNNFQILKAIMKYYYHNELTLIQITKLTHEIHNLEEFEYIYNLLHTEKEKDILNIHFSIYNYKSPIKPLYKNNYIKEFDNIISSNGNIFSGAVRNLKIQSLVLYKSIVGINILLIDIQYCNTKLILFLYNYDCNYKKINVQKWGRKYFYLCVFIRMMKNKYKYIRKMKLAPLINEIKHLVPNDNIKVLSKTSHIHREKLQKFSKVPPHTLFPGGLDIIDTNLLIKEKADGYIVYDFPDNPFEKELKAEYIEEDDIYLVFDVNMNDSIIDRYHHIRHYHPITNNTNLEYIHSPDDLIRLFTEERNRYENFLKNRNGINWYPKAAYMVIDIDVIKNYLYSFANSQYDNFICNSGKNDGLIITPLNGDREIKIKPRQQMTIDLLYKNKYFVDRNNIKYKIKCDFKPINNIIYRCYPVNNQYEARDIRFDKKQPNSEIIVKTIMSLVKADYTCKNKVYYTNYNHRTQEWINIMKIHRKHIQTAINKMNIGYNVLDLGCGSGKLLSFNINYSGYIGIDYDTFVLNKAYNRFNGQNAIFNYMDLAEQWNDTPNIWMTMRPKNYSNIYAISSLMHFNTHTFWDNIDKMSSIGTKFMFNLLNKKILDYEKYTFENNYIYHKDGYIYYKFNSVHKDEMKEKYITIDDINLTKWKIIYTDNGINTLNELYTYYIIEKII